MNALIPKVNRLTTGIYEGRWHLSQFLFFIISLFYASLHCVACNCLNYISISKGHLKISFILKGLEAFVCNSHVLSA